MTLILVDPYELNVASETLRSCAVETADIGTELWACARCAMPAEVDAAINAIVSSADQVLDLTATHLQVRATDLAHRAAIAASDPLAAISVATNIVGGNTPGLTIRAPDPFSGMTIGGGDSFLPQPSTQSILGGVATIGGGDPYGGVTYLPAGSLASGPGIVGPATSSGIPGSSPLSSGLFTTGLFGGGSTPFIGSGDDSNSGRLQPFKEWSNDKRIDTDKDGIPNGYDNNFRDRNRG